MTRPGGKHEVFVSAPGKIFLAGEYGVLYGGEAIVAAVTKRARSYPFRRSRRANPLLEKTLEQGMVLLRELGLAFHGSLPVTDTGELRIGREKLGLGSSAAAAVACLGAILAAAGADPGNERPRILRAAARAHREFQGGKGSGADVAASTLGGVVRVTRSPDGDPSATSVSRTDGLVLAAVWSGRAASTTDLIGRVEAWRERRPVEHQALMMEIREAAASFVSAMEHADLPELLESVSRHHRLFQDLGRQCGAAVVTPDLERIVEMSRRFGGAAKPSGAGGGDLAVAFFPDPGACAGFAAAVAQEGFVPLDAAIDDAGVMLHDERPDQEG